MANGRRILEVKCRCGKICTTFQSWDDHLKAKHPQLRKEMRKDGTLEEDRLEFRKSRQKGYPLST